MATAEGRIAQFVRSEFKRRPSEDWHAQMSYLMGDFFREVPSAGTAADGELRTG